MRLKILKGTVKVVPCGDEFTVSCGVVFELDSDELKTRLHGFLTTSFADFTSARVYQSLLEKEVVEQ
jgi:hypothetical protein